MAAPHHAGPTDSDFIGLDRRDLGNSNLFVLISNATFVLCAPRPAFSVGQLFLHNWSHWPLIVAVVPVTASTISPFQWGSYESVLPSHSGMRKLSDAAVDPAKGSIEHLGLIRLKTTMGGDHGWLAEGRGTRCEKRELLEIGAADSIRLISLYQAAIGMPNGQIPIPGIPQRRMIGIILKKEFPAAAALNRGNSAG